MRYDQVCTFNGQCQKCCFICRIGKRGIVVEFSDGNRGIVFAFMLKQLR